MSVQRVAILFGGQAVMSPAEETEDLEMVLLIRSTGTTAHVM